MDHHPPSHGWQTPAQIMVTTDEDTRTETPWGVDSEYGHLLDVLLCPPDNFHWLPASAISRATLAAG